MQLEELQELEPQEIGWMLLKNLRENMPQSFANGRLTESRTVQFQNATKDLGPSGQDERAIREEHMRVLMEGWQWLEQEGLITVDPIQSDAVFKTVTRRGQAISTEADLFDFAAAKLLPQTLHPNILVCAKSNFIRKDYETAVMHAFRAVEISVRQAGQFASGDVGVTLMRAAFRPARGATANAPAGPLTDQASQSGEQQGMMELFAGAISCFRNPSAHRQVKISKDEAVELLAFASRLLKIVDLRASTP